MGIMYMKRNFKIEDVILTISLGITIFFIIVDILKIQ